MRVTLYILFSVICLQATAQTQNAVNIRFVPTFQHMEVVLEDNYYKLSSIDSVMFETIKGYISAISFYNDGKLIFGEKDSYHLIDAEKSMQLSIQVPPGISYDELHMNIGIDSTTSVSGAMGGELDPVTGMFWTWQSGYINFKLEGKSNLCLTRKNRFQFHLGGYSGKTNCLQTLILPVDNKREIAIEIPLDVMLSDINLTKQNEVMIPGTEAVAMSKKFAQAFKVMP